ncbi:MAG: ribonuclease HI family protein [Elusimicrobiota bacterium]
MKLTIYIDGACRFNPGPAGVGVWIVDGNGRTVREISEFLGPATNNVAEWSAYLRALEEAKALGAGELAIFSDSKLLVEQARGAWKIRDERLKKIAEQAARLAKDFTRIDLRHIPREQNQRADELSKRAVKQLAVKRLSG